MSVHQSPQWTEDEIETLKSLLDKGHSAREIGAMIKRSRNAVLGYIHRNLRKGFVRRFAPKKPRVKKEENKPIRVRKPQRSKHRPEWTPVEQRAVVQVRLALGDEQRLFDITRHQCRWLLDNSINPLVCGEPTHNETSWCLHHHGMVFIKRQEKTNEDGNKDRKSGGYHKLSRRVGTGRP